MFFKGGPPKKNVSKRGYSPDWYDNLHAVFCSKEGLKKRGGGVLEQPRTPLAMFLSCDSRRPTPPGGGGPRAPQDPPGYVPVLWQQASLPPENFLLWLLSYPQNLPESLWPMRATHHTLVKHLMLPPLPPPPLFLAKRSKHFSVSTTKEKPFGFPLNNEQVGGKIKGGGGLMLLCNQFLPIIKRDCSGRFLETP